MYPSLPRTPTSIHPLQVNTTPGDTAGIAPATLKSGLLLSNCEALSTVLSNVGVREWLHAQRRPAIAGAGPAQQSGLKGSVAVQRLRACMAGYSQIAEQVSALPPEELSNKLGRHIQRSFDLCGRQLRTVVAWRERLDKLEANHASPEEMRDASGRLEAASHQALRSIKCLREQLPASRAARCTLLANRILMGLTFASLIVSLAFPPAAVVCGYLMIVAAGASVGMTAGTLLIWVASSRIQHRIASWAREARIALSVTAQSVTALSVTEDRGTRPQWLRRLLN